MKKTISLVLSLVLLLSLFGCSNSKYSKYSKSFLDLFDTASSVTAYDISQSEFDKKYEKLYELHDNMLKYNANYTSVNYKIDKLVNSNVLYQQEMVLEDLCNDINWHNGKFTYDDASNLYVILQEENILKKNLLDEDSCLKLCSKKRGGIKCV